MTPFQQMQQQMQAQQQQQPRSAAADQLVKFYSSPAVRVMSTAGGVASIIHGYRRTGSALWAILWGMFGSAAPFVAVPLAVAQGFGKAKKP